MPRECEFFLEIFEFKIDQNFDNYDDVIIQ